MAMADILFPAVALALLASTASAAPVPAAQGPGRDGAMSSPAVPVVLLHGLARGPASMRGLERDLVAAGHPVCNIGYASRQQDLAGLARDQVLPRIRACLHGYTGPVHFVTHSMGGLVMRQLAMQQGVRIGRVVMLAPPNHGSEIVDRLGDTALFRRLAGPAAQQLRSSHDDAPPASFQLGVLAGDRTLNPWLSLLLPGANDGKVTVASTRLPGMRDFRVLHTSHPLILHNRTAIAMTLNFLEHGCFDGRDSPRSCLREAPPATTPEESRERNAAQGRTSA